MITDEELMAIKKRCKVDYNAAIKDAWTGNPPALCIPNACIDRVILIAEVERLWAVVAKMGIALEQEDK